MKRLYTAMLKIIKTEKEYDNTLAQAYLLMQKNVLSNAESDQLEQVTLLIEDYEKKHYTIASTF